MPTDTKQPNRARRWRRIAVISACAVVFLVVLAGVVLWLSRRQVAAGVARRELDKIGAEGLSFGIVSLGSGGARLADLRVPDEGASVQSASATYSLRGLAKLELEEVEIRGVELLICRDDDGWRLPLADWIGQLRLPPRDPRQPASFGVRVPSLRIDGTIRLLHHRLGEWRLPLRAELAVSPPRLHGSGTLHVLGETETFSADLAPTLDGEVRALARLRNPAAIHTLCDYLDLALPCDLLPGGDGIGVELAATLRQGQVATLSATLTGGGVRLRWRDEIFAARQVRIQAHSDSPDLATWQVTGSMTGLGGMGVSVPELDFAMAGGLDRGTLELRKASLRHGELSAQATGKLDWQPGGQFDAVLRVSRLALGELAVEGVELAAGGTRAEMAWSVAWQGEAGAHGLRRLDLEGVASLAGTQSTSVQGQATVALAGLGPRLGLMDGGGELAVRILPGTDVRLEPSGPAWLGRVEAACPHLNVAMADLRASLDGVAVSVQSESSDATASLEIQAKALGATVAKMGTEWSAKGLAASLRADRVSTAELRAILADPFAPSHARLAVEAGAEEVGVDLAQAARLAGQEGRAGGALALRDLQIRTEWNPEGTRLGADMTGTSPQVSLNLPGELRLRFPLEIRARANLARERISASLDCQGAGLAAGREKATATAESWQAGLAVTDLPLHEMALLRTGKPPEGASLRATASVQGGRAELADWLAAAAGWGASGTVVLEKVGATVVSDANGLSGEASVVGQGKGLRLALPDQSAGTGDMQFAATLSGSPSDLSGRARLTAGTARWEKGTGSFAVGKATATAEWSGLPTADLPSLVRAPATFRDARSPARMSLALGLADGKWTGADGTEAMGVSLVADHMAWCAREGWRSGKDGILMRAERAEAGGFALAETSAKLSLAGNRMALDAALSLPGPGVTAALRGEAALAPKPSLDLSLTIPEFTVSTEQGWVRGLIDPGGIAASAAVAATANLRWQGGMPDLAVALDVRDGNLNLPEDTGRVVGVATRLAVEILPQTRSPQAQELTFAAARLGRLSLGEGRVKYRIDGPGDLFVEEAHAGWSGGSLDTYALRFDATRSDVEATIYASDVDVGRFVELLPGIEGSGQGKLYGRLPAFRRDGRFGYGEGFLYSIPGEEGFLQLRALGMLAGPIAQMGRTGLIVEDSLRDFAYSLFRVDIKPQGHEREGIRIRVVGAKAGQTDARPVDLNVNIGGAIEDALNLGVKVGGLKQIVENMDTLRRLLRKLAE